MSLIRINDTASAEGVGRAGFFLPAMIGVALYLVMVMTDAKLVNDPDSQWHIAVGDWILAHGAFPRTDIFSFSMSGAPWIAKEWLSQIAYAGAFRLAGWTGVAMLAAAAAASAFGLLLRWLMDEVSPRVALLLAAGAFMIVMPHMTARPHVLALPLMVAWIGVLLRAADRRTTPPLLVLPLMIVWANAHGSFIFGLFFIGVAGLDALACARPDERIGTALRWAGFGVLGLAASCVTPYGWETLLAALKVLSLGSSLTLINEWKPVDFSQLSGLELFLLAGAGFAFWQGFRLSPVRILMLLGLVHMALSARRNADVMGLVVPLIVTAPIALQFPALAAQRRFGPAAAFALLPLLALAVIGSLPLASWRGLEPSAVMRPAAALAALDGAGRHRILNDYNFGGYLIASGRPTFIDGRTELYGPAFLNRYLDAVTLSKPEELPALLDQYAIDGTLLMPGTPAAALLDHLPGWRRLYGDELAVAHIRTAP